MAHAGGHLAAERVLGIDHFAAQSAENRFSTLVHWGYGTGGRPRHEYPGQLPASLLRDRRIGRPPPSVADD